MFFAGGNDSDGFDLPAACCFGHGLYGEWALFGTQPYLLSFSAGDIFQCTALRSALFKRNEMGKSNPTLVICPLFLVIFSHTMLNSVQVSNLGGGHLHNFMCEREKKMVCIFVCPCERNM